jgi:transposase
MINSIRREVHTGSQRWGRPGPIEGTRKTMIVALARKLIIALWRFVTTDEPLDGVVLRPSS